MAPYHHQINTYHRVKRARRFKKLSWLLVLLIALFLGFVIFDWIKNNLNNVQVTGNGSESAVRSSSVNIFRTPYFQFQTDKTWREISEVSTDKKYVYRSYTNILVQHELVVEVDQNDREVLDNTQVGYVIPVEIVSNTLSAVGTISPHCKTLIPDQNDRQQRFIMYKDVQFPCDPDSTVFAVNAGLVGGNEIIGYKRTDGSTRTFRITYRDSTFSPNGRPLASILNSFQIL